MREDEGPEYGKIDENFHREVATHRLFTIVTCRIAVPR